MLRAFFMTVSMHGRQDALMDDDLILHWRLYPHQNVRPQSQEMPCDDCYQQDSKTFELNRELTGGQSAFDRRSVVGISDSTPASKLKTNAVLPGKKSSLVCTFGLEKTALKTPRPAAPVNLMTYIAKTQIEVGLRLINWLDMFKFALCEPPSLQRRHATTCLQSAILLKCSLSILEGNKCKTELNTMMSTAKNWRLRKSHYYIGPCVLSEAAYSIRQLLKAHLHLYSQLQLGGCSICHLSRFYEYQAASSGLSTSQIKLWTLQTLTKWSKFGTKCFKRWSDMISVDDMCTYIGESSLTSRFFAAFLVLTSSGSSLPISPLTWRLDSLSDEPDIDKYLGSWQERLAAYPDPILRHILFSIARNRSTGEKISSSDHHAAQSLSSWQAETWNSDSEDVHLIAKQSGSISRRAAKIVWQTKSLTSWVNCHSCQLAV